MTSTIAADLGGHFHGSLLSMILGAGAMVQLVLFLLLLFSVISWAIILMKFRSLNRISKENAAFLNIYMKSGKLSDILAETRNIKQSSLAEIFRAGYAELVKITKVAKEPPPSRRDDDSGSAMEKQAIDNVERALNMACSTEAAKLDNSLGFLATTGSASPFIGLFGTVWGIMDTFKGIGARGSATLAVVAPGISEALIATAAGLAAAIPAVIFYNYYLNRVRSMTTEMDNFAAEMLNIIERYYVRR
jgi:biopolymer transport protein TolQ